jgi:hypothetical protein
LEKDLGQISFQVRNRWLGRIRLRRGFPTRAISETPEHRFYQMLLSTALSGDELHRMEHVVDIGSRNGSYLSALAQACPAAAVRGVELDGGRRYWTGFRRADEGEAYARGLRENGRDAKYLWADFRDLSSDALGLSAKASILMTLFYPFVSEDPCRSWGLPSHYADFNSLLLHLQCVSRANPGAETVLIAAHQGEWEADIARKCYAALGLHWIEYKVDQAGFSTFWPSEYDAYLFRLTL